MFKRIIALALTTTALVVPAPTTYTTVGIVTAVDYETDKVTLDVFSEEPLHFNGTEDWFIGDIAVCALSDNGTPHDDSDDEVLNARYEGSLRWIQTGNKGFSIAELGEKGITGYRYYEWE